MSNDAGYAEEVRLALEKTTALQLDASDPQASTWVSANAGTGKTHVLTMRTLRLLLADTAPERILCLTYTKAAAAEMSTRVFSRLARWVTLNTVELESDLADLLGRSPSSEECMTARRLFTRAIETPGGLKVQTIHAFCERLLQRFPLEAGVPPGFSTVDDDLGRVLKREAIDRTIGEALAGEGTPLSQALSIAVARAAEQRFEEVLSAAIADRRWLRGIEHFAETAGDQQTHLDTHAKVLRDILGVRHGIDPGDLEAEMDALLSEGQIVRAIEVLMGGGKSDQGLAQSFTSARNATTPKERINALKSALLTKDGKPRKRIFTKGLQEQEPGLHAALERARDDMVELAREETALGCLEASLALITLAGHVLQHYTDAKARRAALDFDDLIEKAVSLLGSSEATDWVLYKLDGGLDHILVDESQDTAPQQWTIVEALAREFFAGEGAQEAVRTLFAVGDEKQSIYSFQGAAPEMFAKKGTYFEELCTAGGGAFRHVPLELSFRTVTPVLQAVDKVFADTERTAGLSADGKRIHHAVKRIGEAGLVEIWPTEKIEDAQTAVAFEPLDERLSAAPVERLAGRIANTIASWIEHGEKLVAKDRPIRPGDILILCRKRRPFAAPMVAALKARKIPVAGADRLVLEQQLAVQDLIALGDFTTLPEDDLTLAALLKSPLIGLTEDDLFELAYQRKSSLWKALIDKHNTNTRTQAAFARLVKLRKRADFQPPFEFYAKLLDEDGLRKQLLFRLGHEAADPIDEFLALAIAYDEQQAPSLTGFLAWLRDGNREIKRDMEQGANEVRVMTVHASKGLESPIVFLPDTCSTAGAGGARAPLAKLDRAPHLPGDEPPRIWSIKGASKIAAISEARTAKGNREAEELQRLLYVAMTRAEDRLYVGGFEGANGRAKGCWYDLVQEGLGELMQSVPTADGREVLRYETPQVLAPADKGVHRPESSQAIQPPLWAARNAPRVPIVTLPLAPSQLVPYEADPEGEPMPGPALPLSRSAPEEPAAANPAVAVDAEDGRFIRGTLTHTLFEHLPDIAPERREAAAKAFLRERGQALTPHVQDGIAQEVLAVLNNADWAPLFGPHSQAEVAIAAELPRPDGREPKLRLAGSIDRLAEIDGTILIVDYKTNRDVPDNADETAEAYLLQLAAYRLALKEVYPGRVIQAALLWTRLPRLLKVADTSLDRAEARLWELSAD